MLAFICYREKGFNFKGSATPSPVDSDIKLCSTHEVFQLPTAFHCQVGAKAREKITLAKNLKLDLVARRLHGHQFLLQAYAQFHRRATQQLEIAQT